MCYLFKYVIIKKCLFFINQFIHIRLIARNTVLYFRLNEHSHIINIIYTIRGGPDPGTSSPSCGTSDLR